MEVEILMGIMGLWPQAGGVCIKKSGDQRFEVI